MRSFWELKLPARGRRLWRSSPDQSLLHAEVRIDAANAQINSTVNGEIGMLVLIAAAAATEAAPAEARGSGLILTKRRLPTHSLSNKNNKIAYQTLHRTR